jgi:Putative prokaryotic signal transducing protein
MIEIIRSNDIVMLGAVEALLTSADFPCLIADQHMSALEGSIGAFPRRLLVRSDDAAEVRQFLIEAGFGAELRDPDG